MKTYRDLDNKLQEVKTRIEEFLIITNQELEGATEELNNYSFLKDNELEKILSVLPNINNIEEIESKYKDLNINFELLFKNLEQAKEIKQIVLPDLEEYRTEYSGLANLYNETSEKIKKSSERYCNINDEIEDIFPDKESLSNFYAIQLKGFDIIEKNYNFFNTLFNKENKKNSVLINELKDKMPNLKSKKDFETLYEKIDKKEKEKEKLNKNIGIMKSERVTTKNLMRKKIYEIEKLEIIENKYKEITSIKGLKEVIGKDIELLVKNPSNEFLKLMKETDLINVLNKFIENKTKEDIINKLKDNLKTNLQKLEEFRENINSTLNDYKYENAMRKSSVLNKSLNYDAEQSYEKLEEALEKLNKGIIPLVKGSNLILNNLQKEYSQTSKNEDNRRFYNDNGLINCPLFYSIVLLNGVSDNDYESLGVHFGSELNELSNTNDLNIDINQFEMSDLNVSNIDIGNIDVSSNIIDSGISSSVSSYSDGGMGF